MKKRDGDNGAAGLIVAGVASSSGKTAFTLGLMEALKRRGLEIQPFKAGPDYIDAGLHTAVAKRPSYNLDTWMCEVKGVKKTFAGKSGGADVAVIEGVMGLFDGKDGVTDEGSTAHLAKSLGLPVLLVVNAEKAGRSIAAVIKGFEAFDPKVKIRWVVFNKVASPRHFEILRDSARARVKAEVIGYIPRDASLVIPERHLGLTTRHDIAPQQWKTFMKKAADIVERTVDVGRLLMVLPQLKAGKAQGAARPVDVRARVAVARDSAFCFYYEENLDILKSFGAQLLFFSPLNDGKLPLGTDGIYIGGGYPELYAKALERNSKLREEVNTKVVSGMPVYAECGGLMYLGKYIENGKGGPFEMTGIFPWTSRLAAKRKALGYREVTAKEGCLFLPKGVSVRGHEFHYSELKTKPPAVVRRVFKVCGAGKIEDEGYVIKNALATYVHLHFAACPAFAEGFVDKCEEYRRRRNNR